MIKPIGLTHVLISFIYGVVIISINAIEFYFLKEANALSTNSLNLFWIVAQNVGIAIPNSYYLSKINLSPTNISEETSK